MMNIRSILRKGAVAIWDSFCVRIASYIKGHHGPRRGELAEEEEGGRCVCTTTTWDEMGGGSDPSGQRSVSTTIQTVKPGTGRHHGLWAWVGPQSGA